jgi:hypothetical protein
MMKPSVPQGLMCTSEPARASLREESQRLLSREREGSHGLAGGYPRKWVVGDVSPLYNREGQKGESSAWNKQRSGPLPDYFTGSYTPSALWWSTNLPTRVTLSMPEGLWYDALGIKPSRSMKGFLLQRPAYSHTPDIDDISPAVDHENARSGKRRVIAGQIEANPREFRGYRHPSERHV